MTGAPQKFRRDECVYHSRDIARWESCSAGHNAT
jgi:hypothetical protein